MTLCGDCQSAAANSDQQDPPSRCRAHVEAERDVEPSGRFAEPAIGACRRRLSGASGSAPDREQGHRPARWWLRSYPRPQVLLGAGGERRPRSPSSPPHDPGSHAPAGRAPTPPTHPEPWCPLQDDMPDQGNGRRAGWSLVRESSRQAYSLVPTPVHQTARAEVN